MFPISDLDASHESGFDAGAEMARAPRHDAALQRRRLRREIALAVRSSQLVLHYQPRVSLATGRTVGAEALARWPGRRGGALPPSRFLPLVEEVGMMPQVSAWSIAAACRAAMGWADEGVVSVNVAASQLRDGMLAEQVCAGLAGTGLAPERLELEFDEALLVEPEDSEAGMDMLLTLSALRDIGVGIAVGNFGSGIAGLAMLRRLPLSTVKLDRTLVRDVADNAEDAALVAAVAMAAHAFGLAVVAQGVETEAQRTVLAGLGCNAAQGYLLGAAVPAERFAAALAPGAAPPARLALAEMVAA